MPFKKEKKRSSFGFLKRLSKVVKGQRNDTDELQKKEKKKLTKKDWKLKKKRMSIMDKENQVVLQSPCVSDTNC